MLANLLLDAFDSELEGAGFRLARFADDFVILCKDREQAEAAAQATVAALANLGLKINTDKTAIRTFTQGFRYLGYLFVDGMALDVSGERKADAELKAPVPPPGSWLAKVVQRAPQPLPADGIWPPVAAPTEEAMAAPTPVETVAAPVLTVGEAAPAGTLLFVTGSSPC